MHCFTIFIAILTTLSWSCSDLGKKKKRYVDLPLFVKEIDIKDYEIERAWQELEEKYGVMREKDAVTTYSGKKYQRYRWDDIEAGLMFQQQHPKKTENTYVAYKKHLLPFLLKDTILKSKFDDWLWNYVHVLGSHLVDPLALLNKDKILSRYIAGEFALHLKAFFRELSDFESLGRADYVNKPGDKQKILIIGTSGFGGAHDTVARALAGHLESNNSRKFEVKYVDTKLLHPEEDVMWVFTGSFHSESIYDEIYQKENNPRKARAYWDVLADLKYYIPDRSLEIIEDEVRKFKPHLIFSVIHNRPELVNLSYSLGIPGRIVSTDFELQPRLIPYVKMLDQRLVKILSTTENALFFENLFASSEEWGDFFSPAVKMSLFNFVKEKSISWTEFRKNLPVFDALGFPIRDSFLQMRGLASADLMAIRQEFGVKREDAKVIPIVMGRQGTGIIKQTLDSLTSQIGDINFNLDFFVVTGRNEKLKDELERSYKDFRSDKVNLNLLGLLNDKQIARLYSIAYFVLSKPGGATVAELLTLGIPLVAPDYYSWEKGNLKFLKQFELGFEHKDFDTLALKVNELLSRDYSKEKSKNVLAVLDWKANLERIIREGIELRKGMGELYF